MEENKKIVTRFAPSPTGFLHVGGVRTALYAWLWARKNNGTFILRIEDTDKNREVEGSILHIMESLEWLGLNWDEGPTKDNFKESDYLQSNRLDIYKKYALLLIEKGFAYPDPFSEEEIEILRQKAESEKRPFLYREYRKEVQEPWDGKRALRFKISEIKSYKWNDIVYGDLSAGPEALDDFILIKEDGYPTYNFAHIVDDIEMGITHVMRGQEFISSVPKFLSLYEALGIKPPIFATLPPIMGPDGKKKLSKRDGAKDLLDYKKDGYLPDAFINFLALLGWHPSSDQELFERDELIKIFDISRIGHSGTMWDDKKLNWINKEHIKKLKIEKLEEEILKYLPENMQNLKLIPLIKDRISKFKDVEDMINNKELDFIFNISRIDEDKLIFKNTELKQIKANIKSAVELLEKIEEKDFNKEILKVKLMELASSLPSIGELLHPLRYSLTGMDKSPDPFIISEILGKNETISRLKKVI